MADDKNQADEAEAVTGRPNDIPIQEPQDAPLGGNSTLASRAAANKADAKKVDADSGENKAVTGASTKAARSTKKG
jgi:hypothetical protein